MAHKCKTCDHRRQVQNLVASRNVAGLQLLDGGDSGFDGHDGLDAGDAAANRRREDAQGQDAQPDHVEMGLGEIEKSAAVAQVPEPD